MLRGSNRRLTYCGGQKMSANLRQLALSAIPQRPSILRRSVSRIDIQEHSCGTPATTASGFPGPYSVIDTLVGPLRLPLPSLKLPEVAPVGRLPKGRMVELSNRGRTYVVDIGPRVRRPTFVLLHSLACTGLLTWYPSLEMLRRFGRVVVFDQRCHGSGIASPRFLLEDCADDAVALADELGIDTFIPVGFSMGSLVAQQVWRRHRDRVDGLVLCAAAATFSRATHERLAAGVFAALLEALGPQPGRLDPARLPVIDDIVTNDRMWALGQFQATSYGAMMRALAEITRFDSTHWIAEIDVPTSVLIPLRDRVIPPRHQRWIAEQIPDAHAVTVDAGHAGCTMQWKEFVPGLRSAVDSVLSRIAHERNVTAGMPAYA
jgi:3-oxoadipate enol-lactonase